MQKAENNLNFLRRTLKDFSRKQIHAQKIWHKHFNMLNVK